ncbi:MAG TPA: amidohydrolase family protein, partial [Pirellulales bacterium]|nr:amidohydrolase family protein [Pirellulales bacterium]
ARIVLIQMSFYGFDNAYMLDSIERFPGVFSGVAVIDDGVEAPQAEMRRLALLGVRGFRIYPRNQPVDRWLDAPGMQALWKCGGEDGLAMCHLVNPDALAAIGRMGEKFPDTPIVIDHFARLGVSGEIREADLARLCRLAKNPRAHVKISAFYALGKKQAPYLDLVPMIRRLLDAYGPERLMWATDCPFQVQDGHNYADSIALVRDRLDFLSAGDRDWLLRKTAEKVFFA